MEYPTFLRLVLSLSAKPASLILLAFWSLTALVSCDDPGAKFLNEIDIDLENPEVDLVLESTIMLSDTAVTVFFSRTQSILEETSAALIKEATVELFINDVSYGALEEVLGNSWRDNEPVSLYQLQLGSTQLLAGDAIRIEATTPEGESVSATETMPAAANLASATYLEGRQTLGYYYSDNSVRVVIDDPSGEENHYVIIAEERYWVRVGSTSMGFDTIAVTSVVDLDPGDEFTDGDFLEFPIVSDVTFNGNRGTVILGTWWEPRTTSLDEDTQLWIGLGAINKAGYDYDQTLDALIGAEGNPFAEPAILPSSVAGGRGVLRLINDETFQQASIE